MPQNNAKQRKNRKKSKKRKNNKGEDASTTADIENKKPEKLLLQDYVHFIQQRSLLEVALAYLFTFLMGGSTSRYQQQQQQALPSVQQQQLTSQHRASLNSLASAASVLPDTPQTLPPARRRRVVQPKFSQPPSNDEEILLRKRENSQAEEEAVKEEKQQLGFVTANSSSRSSLVLNDTSGAHHHDHETPSVTTSQISSQDVIPLSDKEEEINLDDLHQEAKNMEPGTGMSTCGENHQPSEKQVSEDVKIDEKTVNHESDIKAPPAPPPPPPPGFLMPVIKQVPPKEVKTKAASSGAEKALLKELESINDPTFVGFLKSQLKVKSHSRDRNETETEM